MRFWKLLWKESLDSDGQQFYEYQWNEQPHLTSIHWTKKKTWCWLSFIFCDSMWSFWVEVNLCRFCYHLFIYVLLLISYQEWRVGIPLASFTPPFHASTWIFQHHVFFFVQWIEVRCGCSFQKQYIYKQMIAKPA
jgi:YD repeat-containing protein